MSKKIRLDIFLLTKGFVDSRQKAQRLILAGKVKDINGKVLDKPRSRSICATSVSRKAWGRASGCPHGTR